MTMIYLFEIVIQAARILNTAENFQQGNILKSIENFQSLNQVSPVKAASVALAVQEVRLTMCKVPDNKCTFSPQYYFERELDST